jgi:hypothetical protein
LSISEELSLFPFIRKAYAGKSQGSAFKLFAVLDLRLHPGDGSNKVESEEAEDMPKESQLHMAFCVDRCRRIQIVNTKTALTSILGDSHFLPMALFRWRWISKYFTHAGMQAS